jgi:membrane protease YdiL (CAAX protease family)
VTRLVVEFITIFIFLPLVFRISRLRLQPLPVLWAVAVYCALVLHSQSSFDRARLWNAAAFPRSLPSILLLFITVGSVILVVIRMRGRPPLFVLPRTQPRTWALILVLYPLLSVYPQAYIYRAFFFARYHPLFPHPYLMIVVSAMAFAYMHLVYRNWLAVALTFLGGLLFAWRYQQTGSLLTSSIEHALYGCWVFTVGLGGYFYHGTYRLAREVRQTMENSRPPT